MKYLQNWFIQIKNPLQASTILGKASKLQAAGSLQSALETARTGLLLLRDTRLDRSTPVVGAVLSSLTILTEEIATDLNSFGAEKIDLIDGIHFLECNYDEEKPIALAQHLPYLRSRLSQYVS